MLTDNIKIRCSAIGYIMTEPKLKSEKEKGELSATAKVHMSEIFVRIKYGRHTDNTNKYTIKGNMVEEDSLTLYSKHHRRFFRKNKEQFENEFISGTPDIIDGNRIIDIKSSWDIFTFFQNNEDNLNKHYYWQLQGYMALTGATSASLAYCLVSTPDSIISDEKHRLFYRMNAATEDNLDYQKACEELERNMVYDDIPLCDRLIEIDIERNNEDIQRIYDRVGKCVEYMNSRYGHLLNPTL